jgi:hypothetical protein
MNTKPTALLLAEKLEQQFPLGTAQHYLDGEAAAELRRLHDLLGKANALARIRAAEIESLKASLYGLYELEKQRDELEQRLTKTEAQLGEAVWNHGELKREQLANQQKTSGSPINPFTNAETQPQRWAVFCGGCRKEWTLPYAHPGKSICAECEAKATVAASET